MVAWCLMMVVVGKEEESLRLFALLTRLRLAREYVSGSSRTAFATENSRKIHLFHSQSHLLFL